MMPPHYVRRCLRSNKQLNRFAPQRHIHILCHVVVPWLFHLMATPPSAVEHQSCVYISEKL